MKNWRIWLILASVLMAGVSVYVFLSPLERPQPYEGTELTGVAADFRLIDQNGAFVSLSDFREKVVVLTFMDSKCKDTCPLTAAHFRKAYEQLNQSEASQIVFIGVNVNVRANAVADVLETTHAWQLDEIPSWHFLTGSREDLEPVWKDYYITAAPSPDGNSIMHTPGTFLIDPAGQKRWYVSTVFSGEGNTQMTLPLSELLVKHISEILRDN